MTRDYYRLNKKDVNASSTYKNPPPCTCNIVRLVPCSDSRDCVTSCAEEALLIHSTGTSANSGASYSASFPSSVIARNKSCRISSSGGACKITCEEWNEDFRGRAAMLECWREDMVGWGCRWMKERRVEI